MNNIAIFVSGAGSNAKAIIDHFHGLSNVRVALVVSSKANVGALQIAEEAAIDSLVLDKHSFTQSDELIDELSKRKVNFIALAGFLWLIPKYLVKAYSGRIVNIHPALLPKHGGKGMYGANVHRAVLAANEKTSGITIHYVNEEYDEGATILQVECPVFDDDTSEKLQQRIHRLEHLHYPKTIEGLLTSGA